jgi:ribosomal protein S18 acetylase RimI-like enzyme
MPGLVHQQTKRAEKYRCQIREISGSNRDDMTTVARLHMQLLGFGPMSGLGERFVREIGYAAPLQDGLLKAALCEADADPAGFIAYTTQSSTFQHQTLRTHWARASWIVTSSLLENPRRVKALFRAIRVALARRDGPDLPHGPQGEIAALAVRPEYNSVEFFRRFRVRVGDELFKYVAASLQREGVRRLRGFLDASNKPVQFMYHRFGARFEHHRRAGEAMILAWVDLDTQPTVRPSIATVPEPFR